MLMVLEALVPCHLQKLKSNTVTMESASAARDEIAAIADLATSLQALLYSTEALTRSDSSGTSLFFFPPCKQTFWKLTFPSPSCRSVQAHDGATDVPLRSGPQGRHRS